MDAIATKNSEIKFERLPFKITPTSALPTQVGLVTLETDLTIEDEMRFFLGDSAISLLHTRIACDDEVTEENLINMRNRFSESLSLFPPFHKFDVIGYGCTSGALMIGEKIIEKIIKSHANVDQVTSPMTAAKRALTALKATNIGYLAPYESEISQKMCIELKASGFEISAAGTFGECLDSIVGNIDPESIIEAILTIGRTKQKTKLDAIFVSCTSLKCASIIEKVETILDIPIFSSNSALAWDIARLSELDIIATAKGRLFNLKKIDP